VLDTTELRYYAAELYRLQGALLLQSNVQGPTSKVSVGAAREPPVDQEAEAYFQKALDIARQQQAKSF